ARNQDPALGLGPGRDQRRHEPWPPVRWLGPNTSAPTHRAPLDWGYEFHDCDRRRQSATADTSRYPGLALPGVARAGGSERVDNTGRRAPALSTIVMTE